MISRHADGIAKGVYSTVLVGPSPVAIKRPLGGGWQIREGEIVENIVKAIGDRKFLCRSSRWACKVNKRRWRRVGSSPEIHTAIGVTSSFAPASAEVTRP